MRFQICRSSDNASESKPHPKSITTGKDADGWNVYTIDIKALDELLDLMREEGPIIIRPYNFNGVDLPTIEIYDDYRE